jgi:hypothetical protein
MKNMMIVIVAVVSSVLLATNAAAGIPRLVNYQAILTDANGQPMNGTHNLTFRVYATSDPGATALWTEVHVGVVVNDGLVSVILGGVTPFPGDLFDADPRWMGVIVDGDPEISPRMRITSVVWALNAAIADSVLHAPTVVEVDPQVGDHPVVNRLSKWNGSALVGSSITETYSGLMGIGTDDPQAALGIRNDTGLSVRSPTYPDLGGGRLNIRPYRPGHQYHEISSEAWESIALLPSNGDGRAYVGINTTEPSRTLDVRGNAYVEANFHTDGRAGIGHLPSSAHQLYVDSGSMFGSAAYFYGKVWAFGFSPLMVIDDPLDPTKNINHAAVQSSESLAIYTGNVALDGNGEAWVQLPDWFEAVNSDFRYQLTCVGAYAPVYVAQGMAGNRFKIAGGQSGMTVSWQVSGVRAGQPAFQVVVDKPTE